MNAMDIFLRSTRNSSSATTTPSSKGALSAEELDDVVLSAVKTYPNVDTSLLRALIMHESGGNPNAVPMRDGKLISSAKGLGQLIDATAREMGVKDSFDPYENARGAARYLSMQLDEFGGDEEAALAAYFRGPEAVRRHLANNRSVRAMAGDTGGATVSKYLDSIKGIRARDSGRQLNPRGVEEQGEGGRWVWEDSKNAMDIFLSGIGRAPAKVRKWVPDAPQPSSTQENPDTPPPAPYDASGDAPTVGQPDTNNPFAGTKLYHGEHPDYTDAGRREEYPEGKKAPKERFADMTGAPEVLEYGKALDEKAREYKEQTGKDLVFNDRFDQQALAVYRFNERNKKKFGAMMAYTGSIKTAIPGMRHFETSEEAEVKAEHPVASVAGGILGGVASTLAGAPAVGQVLSITPRVNQVMQTSALARTLLPRVVNAVTQSVGRDFGIEDFETGFWNAVRSAGGAAVTVIPEVALPANAIQLIGQPMADLAFDYLWAKATGEDTRSAEWWINEGLSFGVSAGFAIRDVSSGKVFKAEQQLQRNEIKSRLRGWTHGKGSKGFEIVDDATPLPKDRADAGTYGDNAAQATRKHSQDDIGRAANASRGSMTVDEFQSAQRDAIEHRRVGRREADKRRRAEAAGDATGNAQDAPKGPEGTPGRVEGENAHSGQKAGAIDDSPVGYGLKKYTEMDAERLSKSHKIEIAADDEHVRDFVNRVAVGESLGKKMLLGKIGNDLSRKIYQETGIDLAGYNLELRSNDIRHALNKHGNEKVEAPRGQQAITAEDIASFPKIVHGFDKVMVGSDNSLHFSKDINGQTTAVTVHAAGNKSLSLKTMYKGKIGGGVFQAIDTHGPNQNAQGGLGAIASTNDKIPHSPEKVNTQGKINSEATRPTLDNLKTHQAQQADWAQRIQEDRRAREDQRPKALPAPEPERPKTAKEKRAERRVKRVVPEEDHTPEFLKARLVHDVAQSVREKLEASGYDNWLNDYRYIVSRMNLKNLDNYAGRYTLSPKTQEVLNAYADKLQEAHKGRGFGYGEDSNMAADPFARAGLKTPENGDDVRNLLEGNFMPKKAYDKYHSEYERNYWAEQDSRPQREAELNRAWDILEKDPSKLTTEQRTILENELRTDLADYLRDMEAPESIINNLPKGRSYGGSAAYSMGEYSKDFKSGTDYSRSTPKSSGPGPSGYHRVEMPEIVNIVRDLLGDVPSIRRAFRKLGVKGQARHNSVTGEWEKIDLHKDIFKDPEEAAQVLGHEIGHVLSMHGGDGKYKALAQKIKNGIHNFKQFIEDDPNAKMLTSTDRKRIRAEVEKLLKNGERYIDEMITRETPYTPDDVMAIWNSVDKSKIDPTLENFIKGLDTAGKKAIVLAATRGQMHPSVPTKTETVPTGRRIKVETRATPEEIAAAYKEAILKEAELRRLTEIKTIHDELFELSKKWRPLDPKADADHIKYRKKGEEVFADAMSVFLNDPDLLMQEAPNFWRVFHGWEDARNPFTQVYKEVQALYGRGEGAVYESRKSHDVEAMDRERAQRHKQAEALAAENKRRGGAAETWQKTKTVLADRDNRMKTIERTLKKMGVIISSDKSAHRSASDINYVKSQVKGYSDDIVDRVGKVAGGWDGDDGRWGAARNDDGSSRNLSLTEALGLYMGYRRILTDRAEIANRHSVETARSQLRNMESELGSEQFKKLEAAAAEYWKIQEEWIHPALEESGAFSDDLMKHIKGNDVYATVRVVMEGDVVDGKTLGPGVVGIRKQHGTLKDIGNSFVSTWDTHVRLLSYAAINRHKLNTINTMKMQEVKDMGYTCEEAKKVRGKHVPLPSTAALETVFLSDKGEVKAYNVDKEIAEMMKKSTPVNNLAMNALRWTADFQREVFVNKNPLFHVKNPFRDAWETIEKNPGIVLRGGFLQKLPRSFLEAWRINQGGKMPEIVREMYKHGALNVGLSTSRKGLKGDYEIEHMIEGLQTPAARQRYVRRAFSAVGNFLEGVTASTEMMTKIAGYKALKQANPEMSIRDVAYRTRTRVGTPDAMAGGKWKTLTNNIFLFSNINLQGMRGSWEAFQENKARGLAFMGANMLLKVPMILAKAGVLKHVLEHLPWVGSDAAQSIEDAYNSTISYYKRSYYVLPTPWKADDGTPYIFTMPMSYTGELYGALGYDILDQIVTKDFDPTRFVKDLAEIGVFSPSRSQPIVQMAWAYLQWMLGQNPEDMFRERPMIPESIYGAGFADEAPYMAGVTAEKIFGQAITKTIGGIKDHVTGGDGFDKSGLDNALEFPGLGQIPSQFLRRADGGHEEEKRREKRRKAKAKKQKKAAKARDEWW